MPSHVEINRRVLLRLGVPEEAIEAFGGASSSTAGEAAALRHWAERACVHSIIVPTEIFSSRRVRRVLEHAFAGSGIQVQVSALDAPEYTRADWWRHEQGFIVFPNDVINYIYYRFKY